MSGHLPHVLSPPAAEPALPVFDHLNLNELRRRAKLWLDPTRSKFPRDALVKALNDAFRDDWGSRRVLQSLSPVDRTIAAVYRRYGGTADGEVIRLDLMARGLLQFTEEKIGQATYRRWKRNPIQSLSEGWVLLSGGARSDYYFFHYGGMDANKPFTRLTLHPGLAKHVEPAGPPPWTVAPAEGVPHAVARRSPAELALDLSRLFSYVVARGALRTRKDGGQIGSSLQAMEKAVPLHDDSEFPLPGRHGLYLEILRYAGMVRRDGDALVADPVAATGEFAQPDARQAHTWARGWLAASYWFDGTGPVDSRDREDLADRTRSGRHVVAWSLGCLARQGDAWFDLTTWVTRLYELQSGGGFNVHFASGSAWDPAFPQAKDKERLQGADRARAWWFAGEGSWYANAVMVTLVDLALVERGRIGQGDGAGHAFRLTELGRAVFGAPEVSAPAESERRRFLVIQPNYDVVAYLDEAGASEAGTLGRLAEAGSADSGPVRTFRLTRESLYQAQESGMALDRIVEFLREHSRREPPANVLREIAAWAGKREALVLRKDVVLLGFPTAAERDAFLGREAGTACGERFALMGRLPRAAASGRLPVIDTFGRGRRTVELDEQGHLRADQPIDTLQAARLRRIARPTISGWQLMGDSLRQAAASGLKPAIIRRWLDDHLAHQMPELMDLALDAWLGKGTPVELGDAVLLHVADPGAFQAIAASPRLRPFLLGSPGPHWIAVKRESHRELIKILEGLGLKIGRELTHPPLSEAEAVAKPPTSASGKHHGIGPRPRRDDPP